RGLSFVRRALLPAVASVAFVAAARGATAQQGGAASAPVLVLQHVTVIAATDAAPARDVTVVIADGRIRDIGPVRGVAVPAGARVVDATGKFLIPGLIDMHVHTVWPTRGDAFFPLFIANGVTFVRDMFGDLDFAAQLRRGGEAAPADRPRPGFITPGPILDGPRPIWQGSRAIATAAEGREAVRAIKQQGADFAKVYSLLPREAYVAIADEAKKQGLPFAGHVPTSVSAAEASDAGQKSIEHLSGMFLASSANEDSLRAEVVEAARQTANPSASRPDWTVEARAAASYDPQKAQALFGRFVKNGTWHVPTLVVIRLPAFLNDSSFLADQRLKYMPRATHQRWTTSLDARRQRAAGADPADTRRRFAQQLEMVGAMHRAGVRILAGSDTPNPYVFPGFSLHDELGLLVQAGLSPLDALQSATRDAAVYLGMLGEIGTVEKGKRADLVLLDANPLEDIGNTRRIASVIVGGRLVSASEIEAMLAKVEAAHAGR
ncbi:MAG: amidohydrolase family protein, partial [Gemmatimonadaceae bacterium]